MIFFVVVNVLRTPRQLRFYALLILVAFAIYPARGSLINVVTGNTLVGRAIWNQIYANPNYLGALTLLMLGLALAIATVKTQDVWVRRAAAAFAPVTVPDHSAHAIARRIPGPPRRLRTAITGTTEETALGHDAGVGCPRR